MTETILAAALQAIMPTLATTLAGFAVNLALKQAKKMDLEITAAQEARLRQISENAIMQVEERAMRAAKAKPAPAAVAPNTAVVAGIPIVSSQDKHSAAATIVEEQAKREGLKIDLRNAASLIDAALPALRAAGKLALKK